MGKQTDAHIVTVNTELGKLKKALDDITTDGQAFNTTWAAMMAAYDKGGKTASAAFGNTLKADATKYDNAVATAKVALTAADNAVKAMDTFVTAKDRSTINPLAKKSIGKAKKFVLAAKAELLDPAKRLPNKSSMLAAYNSCKNIYY